MDNEKKGMTRRQLLTATATGVALAVPGAWALIRWSGAPETTKIVIQGPFTEYGFIPLEDLDMAGHEGEERIQLHGLALLGEGTRDDHIGVRYSFKGPEDPSREVLAICDVFGKGDELILHQETRLSDPRVVAKNVHYPTFGGVSPEPLDEKDPIDSFALPLPGGCIVSGLDRVEIEFVDVSAVNGA